MKQAGTQPPVAPLGGLVLLHPAPPQPVEVLRWPQGELVLGASLRRDDPRWPVGLAATQLRILRLGRWDWVENLSSEKTTWLNGSEVRRRQVLREGDVLHAGESVWGYVTTPDSEDNSVRERFWPVWRGRPRARIRLRGRRLYFGRAPECEVLLPHPKVGLCDAGLEKNSSVGWQILPTASGEVRLNGGEIGPAQMLHYGDVFEVGPYAWRYDGENLLLLGQRPGAAVELHGLRVEMGGSRLLEDIDLRVEPGELVAVIGPTGAGKSTLLRALVGLLPAPREGWGKVKWGEHSIAEYHRRRPELFGWVPQQETVHENLTVSGALDFAARARLPHGLSPEERWYHVERWSRDLGLGLLRDRPLRQLSGGEKRKVALAAELLGHPELLILDEPSAGLDPGTERRLVESLRAVADKGCRVVFSTHALHSLFLADTVVVLNQGRAIFADPPAVALEFFGVPTAEELFFRLPERTAGEWRQAFLLGQEAWSRSGQTKPRKATFSDPMEVPPRRRSGWTLGLLLHRQWHLHTTDWRNRVFWIAQPAAIAALLAWAGRGTMDDSALKLFLAMVSVLWFGCSNGAQEIIGEWSIYQRERLAGLSQRNYVVAKGIFLAGVTGAQAVILFVLLHSLGSGLAGDWRWQMAALGSLAVVSPLLGLLLSATARSPLQASIFVPFALIPLIIFSGYPVPPVSMPEEVLAVARWWPSFQAGHLFDISFFAGRMVEGSLLEAHFVVAQNLQLAGPLRIGEVYDPGWLPWRALGLIWVCAPLLLAILFPLLSAREKSSP